MRIAKVICTLLAAAAPLLVRVTWIAIPVAFRVRVAVIARSGTATFCTVSGAVRVIPLALALMLTVTIGGFRGHRVLILNCMLLCPCGMVRAFTTGAATAGLSVPS